MSGDEDVDDDGYGADPSASMRRSGRGGGGNPLEREEGEPGDYGEDEEYDEDEDGEYDDERETEADNVVEGPMIMRLAPSHPTSLLELDHQLHDLREGGALTGWAEALDDEPNDMHALVTRKHLTARAFAMRTELLVRDENRRPVNNSDSDDDDDLNHDDSAPEEDGFAVDEFPQQQRWNRRRAIDMQSREGVSVYPPDPMPACRIYQRPVRLASEAGRTSTSSSAAAAAEDALEDDADEESHSRKKLLALGGGAVTSIARQTPRRAIGAHASSAGTDGSIAGIAELEVDLKSIAFYDHPGFRLEDCLAMKLRNLYGAYHARVGAARAEIENLQDSAGRLTASARELVLVGDGVAQLEKDGMHTVATQAVEAVLAHAEAVAEIRRLAHEVYKCWTEVKQERRHSGETVTTVRVTASLVRLQMSDATKEWVECAHDLAKALVAFEKAKAAAAPGAEEGGGEDEGEDEEGSDSDSDGEAKVKRTGGEVRTRWATLHNRALDRFKRWTKVLDEKGEIRLGLEGVDYLINLDEDADITPALGLAEGERRASIGKYTICARVIVDGKAVTTTAEMPLEWPSYAVPAVHHSPRTVRIRLLHQPKTLQLAIMWRWKRMQMSQRIALVTLPLPAASTFGGVVAAASSALQAPIRFVADAPIPRKIWTWVPFDGADANSFSTQRFVNGVIVAGVAWSADGVLPPPPPSSGGPLAATADSEAAAHATWSMQLHQLASERSALKSGIGAMNPNDPRDAPLMKQVEQGGGSGFSAVEGGAAAAANRSDALVRCVFRERAFEDQLKIALTDVELREMQAAGGSRVDSGRSRRLMMRLRRERPWAVAPYGAIPLMQPDFSRQLRQLLRMYDNELRARQFRVDGDADPSAAMEDDLAFVATPPTFIEEQLQEARLRQRVLAGSQRESQAKGLRDYVRDKWSFQADSTSWTDVLASIFRPESRLNPPPAAPEDAVTSADACAIKMQIVRATDVPSRVPPQLDDDGGAKRKSKKKHRSKGRPGDSSRMGRESSMRSSSRRRTKRKEEDEAEQVNTFVEVLFQNNAPFETPSRFGTSPQWNEKMHLNITTENGKYNQETLSEIQDSIRIILWDEIELDGKGDRCYLGHVDVPFQTLLQKGRIDGALALHVPPKFRDPKEDRSTCIGYRRQGFRLRERNGEFVDNPTMMCVLFVSFFFLSLSFLCMCLVSRLTPPPPPPPPPSPPPLATCSSHLTQQLCHRPQSCPSWITQVQTWTQCFNVHQFGRKEFVRCGRRSELRVVTSNRLGRESMELKSLRFAICDSMASHRPRVGFLIYVKCGKVMRKIDKYCKATRRVISLLSRTSSRSYLHQDYGPRQSPASLIK